MSYWQIHVDLFLQLLDIHNAMVFDVVNVTHNSNIQIHCIKYIHVCNLYAKGRYAKNKRA